MEANDPRHGTLAGEMAHRYAGQTPCRPCGEANAAYQRRTRAIRGARSMNMRDSIGTRRRIEALMCLGWSGQQIADDAGIAQDGLWALFRRLRITAAVAARIAATYDRLSMSLPPTDTKGQRISVAKTRAHATRRGFTPPLAWNDIDHDDSPATTGRDNDIDDAVVLRVLTGERLPTNTAERHEIMRRWLAAGNSERSLCDRLGWKDSRYGRSKPQPIGWGAHVAPMLAALTIPEEIAA